LPKAFACESLQFVSSGGGLFRRFFQQQLTS
jgi:hypothetical protein